MRVTRAALAGIIAVTGLLAATPGEASAPRKARVPYRIEDENHHVGTSNASTGVWNTEDAYAFPLKKGERSVSIQVVDDREEPVAGVVVQWVWDYDNGTASVGHAGTWEEFCGETSSPVKVLPNIQVEVLLRKGTCENGSPSLPTNGDIYAEFFRRR